MRIQLREGFRIFLNSLGMKIKGHKKYIGMPHEILKQVIDDCWNSKEQYFMTSTGNFAQFWTRDFGICAQALVNLGYKDKVIKTLDYALSRFEKAGKITTTITPKGEPYDFPSYASDSVPFLIHSIKVSQADELIKKYERFLLNKIKEYCETVLDPEKGMIRSDRSFSSMKDYSRRKSSTYDNCMLAMLKRDLDKMNFFNPLSDLDLENTIIKKLWNGKYFYDDLNKIKNVYGDANVFPFWTSVAGQKIFINCFKEMKKAGLDKPFPLKYSGKKKIKGQRMVWQEIVVGDYERHSIWINIGLCYLDVLKRFDKKEFERQAKRYLDLVDKHKNFLEIYDHKGQPFRSLFYFSDESMIWAAKLLDLVRE